jgi:RHS repeat-associated protein
MTLANGVAIASPITTTYSFDLLGRLATQFESNGTISVTTYDATNHILELAHYHDSNANGIVDISDSLVASFAYLVRADGNRIGSFETFADPDHAGQFVTQTFAWVYDAQDRLITETYDGPGTEADYTDQYQFDLAGNRMTLVHTLTVNSGSTATSYIYDKNDRLTIESTDAPDTDNDSTTIYSWGYAPEMAGGTTSYQTGKTVYGPQGTTLPPIEVTTYGFNLQGRMSSTLIEQRNSSGDATQRSTISYAYNDPRLGTGFAGIRSLFRERTEKDNDSDPATALVEQDDIRTSYLIDGLNPTGYAQTIAEIERVANGDVTKATAYVLGLDIGAQITQHPISQVTASFFLIYDAHGSTRALLNEFGQMARNTDGSNGAQLFSYGAFGLHITLPTTAPMLFSSAGSAQTTLLYSGEPTDGITGLQSLDGRYYDPRIARLSSFDPVAGSPVRPLSFNKYIYVHGNPIGNFDPSGGSLVERLAVSAIVAIASSVVLGPIGLAFRNASNNIGFGKFIPVFSSLLQSHYHSVQIHGASLNIDQMFAEMQNFRTLNMYPVSADRDPHAVGDIVNFDMISPLWDPIGFAREIGQGDFPVKVTKVNQLDHYFVVRTMAGHPLAGWRYWGVKELTGGDLFIETFSVEHPYSRVDAWKLELGGMRDMYLTWTNMLLDLVNKSGGVVFYGGNTFLWGQERPTEVKERYDIVR